MEIWHSWDRTQIAMDSLLQSMYFLGAITVISFGAEEMVLRGKITCLCEATRAGNLELELGLPHSKILNKRLEVWIWPYQIPSACPIFPDAQPCGSGEDGEGEGREVEEVKTKIMTHRTGLLEHLWLHPTTVQNANCTFGYSSLFFEWDWFLKIRCLHWILGLHVS